MSDQPTEPVEPPPSSGASQEAGWPAQMPPPPPPSPGPAVPLPPMAPLGQPAPAGPPPPGRGGHRSDYFVGLGTGFIPLVLALLATGLFVGQQSPPNLSGLFVIFLVVALAMYIASIITMIVCLAQERLRFIGYGLLTTFLATPVLGFVGCLAALNYASTHP